MSILEKLLLIPKGIVRIFFIALVSVILAGSEVLLILVIESKKLLSLSTKTYFDTFLYIYFFLRMRNRQWSSIKKCFLYQVYHWLRKRLLSLFLIYQKYFVHSTAFLALLIAYEVPHWIQKESRFMKISREILIFLYCGIASFVCIITYINDLSAKHSAIVDKNVTERSFIHDVYVVFYVQTPFSMYGNVVILWPIMNTLSHLVLIYHTIRGVSVNVFFLQISHL